MQVEEVRAQVHRFWNAFSARAGEVMESMYFPAASVFTSGGARTETARLTLARRLRQFAEGKSSRSAELGTIDVRIMDDVAVASYPYEFHQSSIGEDGSQVDINVPFAGATQVFLRDKSGALRIAHEHFSAAEPGKKTQVARRGTTFAGSLMPLPSAAMPPTSSSGSLPLTDSAFADQVRSEIKRVWQLFRSKNREGIERAYSPTAIVWAIGAKRGLSIRLVLAAKEREVLGPQSAVNADLGSIEVQTISKRVAVASYSFHYTIIQVLGLGKRVDVDIDKPFQGKRYALACPWTRGTQVFERDGVDGLKIAHEHISAAGMPIYTELAVTDNAPAQSLA